MKNSKELFLGLKPPQISNLSIEIDVEDHITSQQHKLIQKAIHSKDLFLIWGPPGTGKTNVVLKKLLKNFFSNLMKIFLYWRIQTELWMRFVTRWPI